MKKTLFAALVAGSLLLLSSCGSQNTETSAAPSTSAAENQPAVQNTAETTTPKQTETSAEDEFEKLLTQLCGGHFLEDSTGMEVPNADYLPLPNFAELPSASVFNVVWDTIEGSYDAGTSFLMETDYSEEPLLITAIHYFGEENYVSGEELPDYVDGGELYDILEDGIEPDGKISGVIKIADAVGINVAETGAKDVAAFTVSDTSSMTAFPVASKTCQPGDVIYLAAYLSDEDTYYYDDCLYPCVVLSDDGTDLYYLLSDMFITSGASGGPLLNTDGEVVGIHIASANSVRYAHSIQSICEQLQTALDAQ